MANQLFSIIKLNRKPVYKLAKEIGVSRVTIGNLIADDIMPRNVQLNTLDKIAAGIGYRVEVNFVPTIEKDQV